MSTFGGKIEEIENISVDRFDEANYSSFAYFLSHCHTDHMEGLNCDTFHRILRERNNTYLYMSPISSEILKAFPYHEQLAEKIKPLVLETPSLVPVKGKFVCVTLLRAGHCPGSVMFLFEYEGKIILYTGDYRIHKNDFRKFNAFKYLNGTQKTINKIYLDTTFFLKNFPSFPSRQTCVKEVCNVIRKIDKSFLIKLETSARYGYEDLLIEISKELNLPVHVREDEYEIYRCIPQMDNAVTLDPNCTPLHNNCGHSFQTICKKFQSTKIIRFSAMFWNKNRLVDNELGVSLDDEDGIIKVCYSTHASLEEGQALIRTLKPEAVHPCVVPKDGEEYKEMIELISEVMKEYKEGKCVSSKNEGERKLFVVRENENCTDTSHNNCNVEQLRSLLESPPIKRKRNGIEQIKH